MKKLPQTRYSGLTLDRAGNLRTRPEELHKIIEAGGLKILPVSRGRGLIKGLETERVRPAFIKKTRGLEVYERVETTVFLGFDKKKAVFAAFLTEADETYLEAFLKPNEFQDLRKVSPYLKSSEAALLAYARGMEYWHRTHKFCGHCGSPTRPEQAGHVRKCENQACAREIFPRTDPAVIMLVTSPPGAGEEKCLLAHHTRIPAKMYSTLAGFVEPGESLEEAVAREVLEETGIAVGEIEYRSSQPWPFPSSVMIGFSAVAKTEAVTIDPGELIEARWFTRDRVRAAEKAGGETPGLILPPEDSIARTLIRGWLDEGP